MGQIMSTTITNNSSADLAYRSDSGTIQNTSGSPYSGTVKAGGVLQFTWEKDSALRGGGAFRDAHITFYFSLTAPTTIKQGPVTRIWPKFSVLLLSYFDAASAFSDWTLTAAGSDVPKHLIPPPFALPSINASNVAGGHATVTIN